MPSESTKVTRVALISLEGKKDGAGCYGRLYEIMSDKTINYTQGGTLGLYYGDYLTNKDYLDPIEATKTLVLSEEEFETLMGLIETLRKCKADKFNHDDYFSGGIAPGGPRIVQASVGRKLYWTLYFPFYEPEYPTLNLKEQAKLYPGIDVILRHGYMQEKPELLDIAYFLIDTFPEDVNREEFDETPKDLKEQGVLDENGKLTEEYERLSRKWSGPYASFYSVVMDPEDYEEYKREWERVFGERWRYLTPTVK